MIERRREMLRLATRDVLDLDETPYVDTTALAPSQRREWFIIVQSWRRLDNFLLIPVVFSCAASLIGLVLILLFHLHGR